ncbi:MAG: aminoacyl-tRNA deacylase [Microgenomates group bacterium]
MAKLKEIENHLNKLHLPYKVKNLGGEVFTVATKAKALGIREEDVVKTLIVRTNDGFAALAVRGSDKVDFKKARKLLGSKCELAREDEVLKVAGVPIGAVCPILLSVPIYIDRNVLKLNNVHMGSGDLQNGLEMKFSDLLIAIGNYKSAILV